MIRKNVAVRPGSEISLWETARRFVDVQIFDRVDRLWRPDAPRLREGHGYATRVSRADEDSLPNFSAFLLP
jgi:hypothetical protein